MLNSAVYDSQRASTSMQEPGEHAQTFVHKLYSMVGEAQHQHLIQWTSQGSSFVVTNISELSANVLAKHFKHSNFSSFVRQLNMYGFHKINKASRGARGAHEQTWEFSHPLFARGRADLLDSIKRKPVLDSNCKDSMVDKAHDNIQVTMTSLIHHMRDLQEQLQVEKRKNDIQDNAIALLISCFKQQQDSASSSPSAENGSGSSMINLSNFRMSDLDNYSNGRTSNNPNDLSSGLSANPSLLITTPDSQVYNMSGYTPPNVSSPSLVGAINGNHSPYLSPLLTYHHHNNNQRLSASAPVSPILMAQQSLNSPLLSAPGVFSPSLSPQLSASLGTLNMHSPHHSPQPSPYLHASLPSLQFQMYSGEKKLKESEAATEILMYQQQQQQHCQPSLRGVVDSPMNVSSALNNYATLLNSSTVTMSESASLIASPAENLNHETNKNHFENNGISSNTSNRSSSMFATSNASSSRASQSKQSSNDGPSLPLSQYSSSETKHRYETSNSTSYAYSPNYVTGFLNVSIDSIGEQINSDSGPFSTLAHVTVNGSTPLHPIKHCLDSTSSSFTLTNENADAYFINSLLMPSNMADSSRRYYSQT